MGHLNLSQPSRCCQEVPFFTNETKPWFLPFPVCIQTSCSFCLPLRFSNCCCLHLHHGSLTRLTSTHSLYALSWAEAAIPTMLSIRRVNVLPLLSFSCGTSLESATGPLHVSCYVSPLGDCLYPKTLHSTCTHIYATTPSPSSGLILPA